MATEINEKTPVGDEATAESNGASDALQPSLKERQEYHNQTRTAEKSAVASDGTTNSSSGGRSLIMTPIFGRSAGERTSTNRYAQNDADVEDDIEDGSGENKHAANADSSEDDYEYYDDDDDDDFNNETAEQNTIGQDDTGTQNDTAEQEEAIIDGKDVPLSPEALKAKEAFIETLKNRLQDDPRFRDKPEELAALEKTLEEKLAKMDQRMLHEQVDAKNGCDKSLIKNGKIDQQKQLALAYGSLSTIANDAEKLTFDNSKEKVFNESWMVNNILVGGIMRGENPEKYENQGQNNTCASTSIDRQMAAIMLGQDFKTAADICTKGQFETVDNAGQKFTCKVDKESMRPDLQAKNMITDQADIRDAYGQISDLRIAQLNLDLKSRDTSREEGLTGGEGRYIYKDVTLQMQKNGERIARGDSGERVIDTTQNNKVIAHSPLLDGTAVSHTKQALFGRYIDPNFGKETTIVSGEAFGVYNRKTVQRLGDLPDVTSVHNGQGLDTHLKSVEAKGWRLPTLATHVGNYVGGGSGFGGAQGWHATSIKSNELGGIDFVNNWGGAKNQTNMNADQLYSWMKAPAGSPESDRIPSDHIFDPDGVLVKDGINPLDPNAEKLSKNDLEDKDKLAQDQKKEQEQKEKSLAEAKHKEEAEKQVEAIKLQLAEIENIIAGLPANDPIRQLYMDEKLAYQNNLNLHKEILT